MEDFIWQTLMLNLMDVATDVDDRVKIGEAVWDEVISDLEKTACEVNDYTDEEIRQSLFRVLRKHLDIK